MPRSPDLTDYDPRRTVWNFLSPIALFASKVVGDQYRNELVPVAIQMDYKPGKVERKTNSVFTSHILLPALIRLFYTPFAVHLRKIYIHLRL